VPFAELHQAAHEAVNTADTPHLLLLLLPCNQHSSTLSRTPGCQHSCNLLLLLLLPCN
jgi:hypothetical protein